jgi:predicted transcriptional regulator of viral defense system
MNWNAVLSRFAAQPLFHSSFLRAGEDDPRHIQVQLCRWVKAGKLLQLRRGWYLLAEPFRSRKVGEAVIANTVVQPSYLSLDWALHFYGFIPEAAFQPTSVTSQRGVRFAAAGRLFEYIHVTPAFFTGFERVEAGGELIVVALPEKAVLDKVYVQLRYGRFSAAWLRSLRLRNLESLDARKLRSFASLIHKPGFDKIVAELLRFLAEGGKDR